jgi:Trm5-related predicted tRNA methylase
VTKQSSEYVMDRTQAKDFVIGQIVWQQRTPRTATNHCASIVPVFVAGSLRPTFGVT